MTTSARWMHRLLRVRRLASRALGRSTAFTAPPSDWHARIWRDAGDLLGLEFSDLGDGVSEFARNGRATRTLGQLVMLNDPVTLEVSGNKPLVYRLLDAEGVPTPPHVEFNLEDIATAIDFLDSAAESCVVKPAQGGAGGAGVTTGVRDRRTLKLAAAQAALRSRRLVIERQVPGTHYRLLYLDGELLDAVRRPMPSVTGDGRSTVARLIRAENSRRRQLLDRYALKPLEMDLECKCALRAKGLSLRHVPRAGEQVIVRQVSNMGSERDSESVRGEIGEALVADCARGVRAVGGRLAGVDVITTDPTVSLAASHGAIVDINATPGLFYHYQVRNSDQAVHVAVPILRALLGLGDPCTAPALLRHAVLEGGRT